MYSVRLATEEAYESKHRAVREKWKALNRKDLRQVNSNLLHVVERRQLEIREASKKAEIAQRKINSMSTELESYKKRMLKAEQELRRKDMKLAQLQYQLEQRDEEGSQNGSNDGPRKRRRSASSFDETVPPSALAGTSKEPFDALEFFADNVYQERQRKVARPARAERLAGFLDYDPSENENVSQPVSDGESARNGDTAFLGSFEGAGELRDPQQASQEEEVTEVAEHSPDVVELSEEEDDDSTDAGSSVEEQLHSHVSSRTALLPAQDMTDSDDRLQEQLQRTISRIRAHLNPIVIPDDDVIDLVSSDEEGP
ncbi:hypothetical protein BCR43DRAFT_180308 [Syncephalastrum racemosum]|uniref:Uncharacterized protein n=1 Tax=Syncephalastrum racemosum TaxID=13706 RepID=A0A1X2HQB6_SYNRA|nr:hypothetical protein BCR43DRAFT_180308 [Syncephalastrum racemosum]